MRQDQRSGKWNIEKGHKGFLLPQCEKCGRIKGFNAKRPTQSYVCECGHVTRLGDMRPALVQCEKCGSFFRYRTNAKDRIITHTCLTCGAPVDLEYSSRKGAYITLKD